MEYDFDDIGSGGEEIDDQSTGTIIGAGAGAEFRPNAELSFIELIVKLLSHEAIFHISR
jgi:hypothetical protein